MPGRNRRLNSLVEPSKEQNVLKKGVVFSRSSAEGDYPSQGKKE
jgi:hypothetical protein